MKIVTRLSLLFFCWVITQPGAAQVSIIKGNIPEGKGQIVRLLAESNPFTRHLDVLAIDTCSDDGSFIFSIDTSLTFLAGVDVWFKTDWFWITPGDTLTIQAMQPIQPGFGNSPGSAGFAITSQITNEIGSKISEFDMELANFLDSNFNAIFRKRDINIVRKFIHREQKKVYQADNGFFADYMRFSLMGLSLQTMVQSPETVSEELFNFRPNYQQPAYLELVSQIFKNYHLKRPDRNTEQLIKSATEKQYTRFISLLESDSLFNNTTALELATIQIITDIVYALPPEKRLNPISLLDSLATVTQFAANKLLATKVGNQLRDLLPGTIAPPLVTGSQPITDTLDGKPVLVVFSHTKCPSCIEAADWLASFKSREHWQCRIISVSLDYNRQESSLFSIQHPWPWETIWGGNDITMMYQWKINSLPLFAIIDKEGKIIQYPAVIPGPDTEKYLLNLTKSKQTVRRP